MLTLETITSALVKHPEGLSYSQIMATTKLSNSVVWDCIRSSNEFVKRDNKYFLKKYNLLLDKCENRKGLKNYSLEYFQRLSDWSHCCGHAEKRIGTYRTKSGNAFDYDSKTELKILKYLDRTDFVIAIGGQNFLIPYSTDFADNKKYYPDIVIYTSTHHIIFIEVKSIANMSYHLNLSKYEALKRFCKQKGYGYTMVDPDSNYTTIEELKNEPKSFLLQNIIAENFFYSKLKFNKQDVDEWYTRYRLQSLFENREQYYNAIRAIIIRNNWYNRKEFGFEVTYKPVKAK
ncbi:MAG: hypothetical protein IJI67_03555 [Clostridia bacterium]|nr:hypothetical protein [Clostridia bacterium]